MAVRRPLLTVALALVLAACSGKGGSSSPVPRGNEEGRAGAVPTSADPREGRLSAAMVQLLEEEHLRHHELDDAVSRAAFKEYVKGLDPGKLFLLKSDADALKPQIDRIDDELESGRLELAHLGEATFRRRVAVVEKMVAELLAKPFDAGDEEWLETDPDKTELAASEDELRQRWRKRLELEVLERTTLMEERLAKQAKKSGATPDDHGGPDDDDDDEAALLGRGQIPATPQEREAKARADLAKSHAARFTRLGAPGPLDAAAALMNAVSATFDPHTTYLPPDDKANFDIQMSGSLEGIGAVLREDEHLIRVVELVPGGASWRQGDLEAGDLILSVAQHRKEPVDVTDMRIDEVVKMIRGPKGTIVTLTVKNATDEIEIITITRDVVVIEEAYARGAVLKSPRVKQSYGYIYLPSFYGGQRGPQRTAAGDVRRLLKEMEKRKVPGVILDLRQNGGGLLGDAVELTGELIDRGPVVQTQVSDGGKKTLSDDEPGLAYSGAVVVLVDRFSASASEIVAGALQDYHRAVIVGTGPTHGKGTVQILANLDELTGSDEALGALKITVQQFFRVSGASTQWQGVVPDVVLPDPNGHIESGERELENSIPWTEIEAVPHKDWPATWNVADLAARSARRVAASDVFAKIAAQTQLLRARKDTKVPLSRTAWLARRAELRAALDAVDPTLDKGPKRFTLTMIDYAPTPAPAARPGGKVDDRIGKWRETVSKDPWIEECLLVLADMAPAGR